MLPRPWQRGRRTVSRRRQGGGTIVNARFAFPEGPSAGRSVVGIAGLSAAALAGLGLTILLALGGG